MHAAEGHYLVAYAARAPGQPPTRRTPHMMQVDTPITGTYNNIV